MSNNKNFFFVLREPIGPYKFLIGAAKTHSEKLANEKLTLYVNKNHKRDYVAIFYLIRIIFQTNFFSKKKLCQLNIKVII